MPRTHLERDDSGRLLWRLIAGVLLALVAFRTVRDRDMLRFPVHAAAPAAQAKFPAPVAAAPARRAPVRAFLAWVDTTHARDDHAVDRAHVAGGLRLLAAAFADLAARTPNPGVEVVAHVNALQLLAAASDVSDDARAEGFLYAALDYGARGLTALVARVDAPGDGATELAAVTSAIDPRRPVDDQQAEIAGFFERAAATVREVRAEL